VAGFDAVFVGAGINSLAGAALLSRAGWSVCVLEREDELGGCIKTVNDLTAPGFTHELLAAWHPLWTGSPAYAELKGELDRRGLEYLNTDLPTGSAFPDGSSAFLTTSLEDNVAELDRHAAGDGARWQAMFDAFMKDADLSFGVLGTELWSGAGLTLGRQALRRFGRRGLLAYAGGVLTSCRDWLGDTFESDAAHGLLAPWTLHTGLGPDQATSGFMTQVVACALQLGGMPVPRGGGGQLVDALAGIVRSAGPLGGRAWGSRVSVGSSLESGPSFTTYLPCPGTNGKLIKQSGAVTSLPAPIQVGSVTNTAVGSVGKLVTSGETTSRIVDVNLGDGQITADLIKADAAIQRKNGQITIDTSGSHFGSLFIQGQGQAAAPDPNTVIEIPGLGKVTLYEVTRARNFVIVRMFHLQVLQDNPDIPIGTDVVLGYAKVSVH